MSASSTNEGTAETYTSRRDRLPTIRKKVDALKPKADAVSRTAPRDPTKELQRFPPTSKTSAKKTASARVKGFDGSYVDRVFQGVKFVEDDDAAPAPKKARAKKTPAKKKVPKSKAKATPAAKKSTARKKKSGSSKRLRPQCAAVTDDDAQCRNSARLGSKYCGSHKGYHPKGSDAKAKDTVPKVKGAKDTLPAKRKAAAKTATKQARCAAKTAAGKRCQNTSRTGSKYCGSHKGYRA